MVREGLSEVIFKLKSTRKREPCEGCMQTGQEKQGRVPGKNDWHGLGSDKWLKGQENSKQGGGVGMG